MDKKKLGALVDKHAEKKAPPKKPGFGGGKPGGGDGGGGDHVAEEAHEEGDTVEHEQEEHDEGDAEKAQQQAARIANGNGDDDLHGLASQVDTESEEVPAFALDADIWERAKNAVRALEDPPEPEDEAAVIVHTYDALGGECEGIDDDDAGGGDDDEHEDPADLPDDAGE